MTEQLRPLHFTGTRNAEVRLRRLRELRVLDRSAHRGRTALAAPRTTGVLDTAGVYGVAAARELDPADLHRSRQAALKIADSAALPHLSTTNDFATLGGPISRKSTHSACRRFFTPPGGLADQGRAAMG